MKVTIVAKETIKPCSPIPDSFKLSILDQLAAPAYTKLYFFYENTSSDDIEVVVANRTQCLKSSLSQILTSFYPFAGKIRDQMSVSFGEGDGAEFVEAKIDSTLKECLENPNYDMFLHLVSDDFWEKSTRPLLIVQANFFKCGGLAIGMNISHKVSDGGTFTTFINAWANISIGKSSDTVKSQEFSSSTVFPAVKELFITAEEVGKVVQANDKTKRFVFTANKVAALQETATNENIPWTSRTEIVTAFLWRIGMKMSMKRAGCSPVPSFLLTALNLRKLLPLLPINDQTFGNMVEPQVVINESGEIELPYLINLYREEVKKSREACKKILDGQQFMERFVVILGKTKELLSQAELKNTFFITSWNKFPFYEDDFGWGKPIWVATHNPTPYLTILMDTRDGTGIEAWVNLPEEQMDIFSTDEELLKYAAMDPSAL